jgi:hypothetical protein
MPDKTTIPKTNKSPAALKPVKKATPSKSEKSSKQKMVRDSFTMPEDDYSKLDTLKAKCLENGIEIKKSELLRAGLIALSKLATADLVSAVQEVEKIKTGRPKGE